MIITEGIILKDDNDNNYLIEEMIGNGGFANVYKAKRKSDNEVFAIKVLSPNFKTKEGLLSFQKELQLSETLESPNIIRYQYVHDGSKFTDYPPYIIMEYADLGSLSDLIEKQQKKGEFFEIETLKQLFLQLASGMEIINRILVHRDIKPDNILIFGDTLKISDFGLSKFSGDNTRTLTFKGYGTVKYIAPEAWDNDNNTIQMDIYSMGIVFYELATLQYPYEMKGIMDFQEYREAHLYKTVKNPIVFNPQLPPSIVSIIIRMLQKPLKNRFANWEDIIELLKTESMSKDKISDLVDNALKKRNDLDIKSQEKLAEEKRLAQIKEDFIRLIYSQYENTIIAHLRDFISDFNNKYAGAEEYKIIQENYSSRSVIFSTKIVTPSSNNIKIEMEAILKENHNRKVPADRFFNKEGYRIENYIPQCENRDILAWGQVSVSNQFGFNLLLLKVDNEIYGEWFVLENTNSGFGNSNRPEPFGFRLDELPREIEFLRTIHIYDIKIMSFDINYIIEFISKYE